MGVLGGLVAAIRRVLNPVQYAASQSFIIVRDRQGVQGLLAPDDHGAMVEWWFECVGDTEGALRFCCSRFQRVLLVITRNGNEIRVYFAIPIPPNRLTELVDEMSRIGLRPANVGEIVGFVSGRPTSTLYLDV